MQAQPAIISIRDLQSHSSIYWRIKTEAEKKYGFSLTKKASLLMTEIVEDRPNQYRVFDFDTGRFLKVGCEGDDGQLRCNCGYDRYRNSPCSHLVAVRMTRDFLNEVRKQPNPR